MFLAVKSRIGGGTGQANLHPRRPGTSRTGRSGVYGGEENPWRLPHPGAVTGGSTRSYFGTDLGARLVPGRGVYWKATPIPAPNTGSASSKVA